jgi:ABC-type transport system involved in cytochrome bd biosynthesis fused ATPase/permease subunit
VPNSDRCMMIFPFNWTRRRNKQQQQQQQQQQGRLRRSRKTTFQTIQEVILITYISSKRFGIMQKTLVIIALVVVGLCALEAVDLVLTMQLYSSGLG